MHRGYVKTYRALKDWCYFKNSSAVHLLTFIILEANYKPEKREFKGNLVIINSGQLLTGRKYLSEQTGISESSVERWLKKFVLCGEIEQQKSTKNRIITLLKWEQFQVSEQQADNKRTTSGQQTDTPNKDKKEEKEKKETLVSVVDYLNSKLLTNYKPNTKSTKDHILARLNEGFTLEEFKTVIDKKYKAWHKDEKMSPFLRPQTLFGTKFEGYLNEQETIGGMYDSKIADTTGIRRSEF